MTFDTAHPSGPRRTRWVVLTAATLVGITGCAATPGASPAGTTPETAVTSAPSSTTARPSASARPIGDPVLQALAEQLAPDTLAGIVVRTRGTTAKVRPTPWLTGWRVYDLENRRGHPMRLFVAQAADGRTLPMTGLPENVNAVSQTVPVVDAQAAAVRAVDGLELARTMDEWAYPIASVDEIGWVEHPDADQVSARERLIGKYRDQISAARATESGDGWQVIHWRVEGLRLVQHHTVVGRDGRLTDTAQVAEENIPVPESH